MTFQSLLFFLGLIALTVLMFIFPFAPAWLEWKNKTDAKPFNVHFEDRTLVDYLIRVFNKFIQNHFSKLIEKCIQNESTEQGTLKDNLEYYISLPENLQFSTAEIKNHMSKKVIVFCKKGVLPSRMAFKNRIFAQEDLTVGSMAEVNEVMACGKIYLEENVTVKKLLASDDEVIIQEGCELNGYVRARNKIQCLGDLTFQYLNANQIQFGTSTVEIKEKAVDVIGSHLPRVLSLAPINLPAFSDNRSHYVSKKSIFVGKETNIVGNFKSREHIQIEENSIIIGSLFCEGDITIGDNCKVQGPIVSTGTLQIGRNCLIGSVDVGTSVIARRIYILSGCLVKGILFARVEGNFTNVLLLP